MQLDAEKRTRYEHGKSKDMHSRKYPCVADKIPFKWNEIAYVLHYIEWYKKYGFKHIVSVTTTTEYKYNILSKFVLILTIEATRYFSKR